MATVPKDEVMPPDLIAPLEALIFQAIGLTTIAVATVAGSDLTLPKWRALVILGNRPATSIGELGRAMGMSMPSASRLVRRLKARGLVSTTSSPKNGRITLVELTPTGSKLRNDVIITRRLLIQQALSEPDVKIPDKLIPGLGSITEALGDYS